MGKRPHLKQLKNRVTELRRTFEETFAVRHVAEHLASFDGEQQVDSVRAFMGENEYDVVGVRDAGYVCGYVRREHLIDGRLRDHVLDFSDSSCVDESLSLLQLLETMKDSTRLFVSRQGRVYGIVTRGDLQKGPIRMWLFCIISLVEMQLLRLIREYYADDSWKTLLGRLRIKNAMKAFNERRRKNEHIDLADCLQFCDKREIVLKTSDLWKALALPSKAAVRKLLEELEDLRNVLAHAQPIGTKDLPRLARLAADTEKFLSACEALGVERTSTS